MLAVHAGPAHSELTATPFPVCFFVCGGRGAYSIGFPGSRVALSACNTINATQMRSPRGAGSAGLAMDGRDGKVVLTGFHAAVYLPSNQSFEIRVRARSVSAISAHKIEISLSLRLAVCHLVSIHRRPSILHPRSPRNWPSLV